MAPIPNEPEPKAKSQDKSKATPVPMHEIVVSSDEVESGGSDIECCEHPDQMKSKEDQHGNKTHKRTKPGQGGKKKKKPSKKKTRCTVAAKAHTEVQFDGVSMTTAEDNEVERSEQASVACAAAPQRTSVRNTNSSLVRQNGAKV